MSVRHELICVLEQHSFRGNITFFCKLCEAELLEIMLVCRACECVSFRRVPGSPYSFPKGHIAWALCRRQSRAPCARQARACNKPIEVGDLLAFSDFPRAKGAPMY